jgi:hypothetical protein
LQCGESSFQREPVQAPEQQTVKAMRQKKPGAPDSPSAIQDTKSYLEDLDRVRKTAKSDQELFDKMTELYPHWVANKSWLMFGFPQS